MVEFKTRPLTVLLVEDNAGDARLFREYLIEAEPGGFRLFHVSRLSEALEWLDRRSADAVLLDLSLPDCQGLETFTSFHRASPRPATVVVTGLDDSEVALIAVREGAQDYLVKGQMDGHLLARAIRYAVERKRVQEELVRQKEFSERLINSSMDGILAFDQECRYTLWNPAMERISGVPKEQVLGQRAFDVFPFLLEIGEDEYFHAALAGRSVVATDRPFYVPETGRTGFFEGYYSPIRDEVGQVVGGLAIIRDITERKRAEAEREKLIAELREALANVKTLKGLIPICAACKKVRDDQGYWNQLESYIRQHSEAEFSHGLCPDCMRRLYPEYADQMDSLREG